MKKLLWVGDAGCPSGFARATHEILERVRHEFEVTVLGVNYRGDPHNFPYPIYVASAGGDAFGLGRLAWMCDTVKPDVIVIQQDGWYFPHYFAQLRKRKPSGEYFYPEIAATPVVGAVAIDGKNFNGDWIKDLDLAIFWTQFGLDEARIGGYAGPAEVIPLGVDLETFYPVARDGALHRQKVDVLQDKFIVGNINRNQYRKRWDLTLQYFSEWVHSRGITDAQLFLHSAPTGDESIDVLRFAQYYGIANQVALCEPEIYYGKFDVDIRDTYNCFDVCITTTQGEGMGLTTMEAMACGVPCIVPEWSALGDWAKGAASMVPCTSTSPQLPIVGLNVIGGVPDKKAYIEALDALYRDKGLRQTVAERGLARVSEPQYRWQYIGEQWVKALQSLFVAPEPLVTGGVWQELKPESVNG